MVTIEKRAVFVESGRRGARRRWGEPRIVRLDQLSGPQRKLVLALVDQLAPTRERDELPSAA